MSHSTHLRVLEASGLVSLVNVLPEVEYLFRHTLIQEAAYGSLLKSDRQSLHKLTGSVMEEIYQEREDEIAPLLARHFYAANDHERALKYFTISGDKAMAVYAIPEAIEHYKFALEIAKYRATKPKNIKRLFLQLGGAYELNAQYELALENYKEMEAFGNEEAEKAIRLAAIIARAKLYATPSAVHNGERVLELSNLALQLAEEIDDRASQTRVHWILSLLSARTGKYVESILQGEKAVGLARELGNNELLAYALHDVSQSYLSTYQFKKGYKVLGEAQSLWREIGNLPMLVDNISTMIAYDYFIGAYDRALENYSEAATLSESIGNLWGQAYCRMYVGSIYFDRGHPEEALQIMKKCFELAKQAGFIVPLLTTQAEMGVAYAYLGESEHGIEIIEEALKNSGREISGWNAIANANKARIHIKRGEFNEAKKQIRIAQITLQTADPLGFARIYMRSIECELALGEKDYRKALEISDLFDQDFISDIHQFAPRLYYLRGLALRETGAFQGAHEAFTIALKEAEGMQMRRITWQIQAALADVADAQDHPDQARQRRAQAKDTIHYIAGRTGSEQLRASFLSRPDVSELLETE